MKLTINTKEDSKEDIMHAIALLERYVATEKAYMDQKKDEPEPADSALAGFANMMNSEPVVEEEKEEVPKVEEY